MCVDIPGVIIAVIVGRYYALMPAEVLSCKLHPQLLRLLHGQPALHVLGVKTENEMMPLHFPFFTVLLPLAVTALAVQVICPRCGVDGVNQVILPQLLDMVVIVDRACMAVMLKENVSDERMVVCVMYG